VRSIRGEREGGEDIPENNKASSVSGKAGRASHVIALVGRVVVSCSLRTNI
jgi:hypothetical protein